MKQMSPSCLIPCTPRASFFAKVNHCFRYVHSCLDLTILIKMSPNNPGWNRVVLESAVKPNQGCLVWQKMQESLTQDANWVVLESYVKPNQGCSVWQKMQEPLTQCADIKVKLKVKQSLRYGHNCPDLVFQSSNNKAGHDVKLKCALSSRTPVKENWVSYRKHLKSYKIIT